MNRKLWLFVAAYFVITMAWAYPWHIIWFHDRYEEMGALGRKDPIIPFGMLAVLIQGVVIGYFYPFYRKETGNQILQGIKFAMIIGLLIYSVMAFTTVAKLNIEPIATFLAYHTVFQFIQFLLTGAALGWIFRK